MEMVTFKSVQLNWALFLFGEKDRFCCSWKKQDKSGIKWAKFPYLRPWIVERRGG